MCVKYVCLFAIRFCVQHIYIYTCIWHRHTYFAKSLLQIYIYEFVTPILVRDTYMESVWFHPHLIHTSQRVYCKQTYTFSNKQTYFTKTDIHISRKQTYILHTNRHTYFTQTDIHIAHKQTYIFSNRHTYFTQTDISYFTKTDIHVSRKETYIFSNRHTYLTQTDIHIAHKQTYIFHTCDRHIMYIYIIHIRIIWVRDTDMSSWHRHTYCTQTDTHISHMRQAYYVYLHHPHTYDMSSWHRYEFVTHIYIFHTNRHAYCTHAMKMWVWDRLCAHTHTHTHTHIRVCLR